jgi:adenylate cyclase
MPNQQQDTLQELSDLRSMTLDVAAGLRSQDELLRQRGMKLPPGVIQSLSSLIKQISALEDNLGGDFIELKQLRSLASTGALINSTLNIDDVLTKAMDNIIELTGAERGFMVLQNQQSDELEFRIIRDTTNKNTKGGKSPQISMTIVNEAITNGASMLTDNAYKDPRIQDNLSVAQFVLRSVICVPLTQRSRTIGAVYVDNRLRAGVFTERELNLLEAFANQAAVAIENARLFSRIQASLQEITEMKDVMDSVFESIGSGIITTNASNLIISFNRAAEHILGVHSDKAIGKPLLDILPRIDETDIENQIDRVLESSEGASLQASVDLPHQDGQAIISLKFSPLKDDDDITQGVTVVVDDLTDQNEREAMLDVLQNYLPPGMMSRIHEIAGIDLGGERRQMTCMFAETRPFNSFPPDTAPAELMTLINRYLSVATEAIHGSEGIIDKYMGSEIMVLFNTQLNPQENHALLAMHSALAIREAFVDFYQAQGLSPDPHFYRIGIHTGIATLGNVGSLYRRNFTAIGDTINLSKRLEENATSGQIVISEDALRKAQAEAGADHLDGIRFEERDPVQVKGRQQYTRIYEIFRE